MFQESILLALKSSAHQTALAEIMAYAVLPAGKLFRPRLVEALSKDLTNSLSTDFIHLASSIEIHHAYTLVHDDLPAMDNDLMRRGKPSTHAKYGEWKAILAGDALLISSFHELGKICNPHFPKIFKLFSWATGAKGLIQGQFLDLEADGKLPFHEVLRVHELKTARLIQIATLGSYFLAKNKTSFSEIKDFLRIGRAIGVCFQLMDDLSELTVPEVSPRELEINPFFTAPQEVIKELKKSHQKLNELLNQYQLKETEKMMNNYFKQNQKNWMENIECIETHLNEKTIREWITTYV